MYWLSTYRVLGMLLNTEFMRSDPYLGHLEYTAWSFLNTIQIMIHSPSEQIDKWLKIYFFNFG